MGVKGLWKLIEGAGVPVPLETLEQKILGVDVSIWLHQAVRGFRGPGGAAVANAHLLTLFHRICKLLFYRIRPVFVFDGGVPHLKKQTLASRRLRREVAASKAQQVRKRLLDNLMKSQAVRRALGKSGPGPSLARVSRPQLREKDMFELPPLPAISEEEGMTSLLSEDEEDGEKIRIRNLEVPNLHHFDLESEEFKALPIETQHEILSEMQDTRKENSWHCINDMPQKSEDFSSFQMSRLLKRSKFQTTLDSAREEIRKKNVAQMEVEMFGELEQHVSLSQQIISEDSAHSLLVKKVQPHEEQEKEDIEVKEDKDKSPVKRKPETFRKDFLNELAKQGVVRSKHSDSDSDLDEPDYHNGYDWEAEESESKTKKQKDLEDEEGFLQTVSALMENSGLTQDEILTIIKQDSVSNLSSANGEIRNDVPSTSEKASGVIFNPDADSSSDDGDFIEVSECSHQLDSDRKQVTESEKQAEANNIDKLLSTKSDSLWMKIVQQKLDDMVHCDKVKSSPSKAIVDSRKINTCNNEMSRAEKTSSDSQNLKAVKISLDFEVKPLKMEDDIFSDIFADIHCKSFANYPASTGKGVSVSSVQVDTQGVDANKIAAEKGDDDKLVCSSTKTMEAVNNLGVSSYTRHGSVSSETEKESVSAKNCSSVANVDMECKSQEQEILTRMPSEAPVKCSTNELLKNIKVDEALKSRLHELVKLEIEKVVSTSLKEDKPETGIVHNTNNSENNVEFMSSSEDSDTEESLASEIQTNLNGNSKTHTNLNGNSKTHDSTAVSLVPDTVQTPLVSDSETDDDDFTEVREHNESSNSHEIVNPVSPVKNSEQKTESKHRLLFEQKAHHTNAAVDTDSSAVLPDDENIGEETSLNINQKFISNGKELEWEQDEEEAVRNGVETPKENVEQAERPVTYTEDELKQLEGELATEQKSLVAEAKRTDRIASSLNDQMYGEAQHLLQLFGIPYLVAPMEAEAQCAFLDMINLTAGTITDDSDIFLFGGHKVYKNFFNQAKHVEFFKLENVEANFGLDRNKMITVALLTGSDYTDGVESVGAVAAMEVLAEFPGEGIDCLHNLKKWWDVAHKHVSPSCNSKVKQKMSRVTLVESFPNANVYDAYLQPEVDESTEKFTWAVPNVEALRTFTMEKFGWNPNKTDEILVPVMKKLGVTTSQMRIDSFFTNIKLVKEDKIPSKRVQEAIARARGEEPVQSGQKLMKNKRKKPSVDGELKRKKMKKENKTGVIANEMDENSITDTVEEENTPEMERPSSSKPSGTLLIDPSESTNSVSEANAETKRKSKVSGARRQRKSSHNDNPVKDTSPPRKLTKEIMYKALLEKETISQREMDKKKMEEKKVAAAQLLKQKLEKGRTRKR